MSRRVLEVAVCGPTGADQIVRAIAERGSQLLGEAPSIQVHRFDEPDQVKPKKVLWTADETRSFLQWCRDTDRRLFPSWVFVATSADRRGANLGLRWSDIDFETGRAQLIWAVTCVRHKIVVKPYGKSGRTHEIIVDPGTLQILAGWRERQLAEREAFVETHRCRGEAPDCDLPGFHDRDLVFARPDGNYLHPERFSREFTRAQSQYNKADKEQLPRITVHGLRHGWATAALEAGIPMKVVQDRLDHSSERITADVYTHVRAPLRSSAAEIVSELLLPPAKEQ